MTDRGTGAVAVLAVTGALSIVIGVPLLLALPPLGAALLWVGGRTLIRLRREGFRPTPDAIRSCCREWFAIWALGAVGGLGWAAVRSIRGDSATAELTVGIVCGAVAMWWLGLSRKFTVRSEV